MTGHTKEWIFIGKANSHMHLGYNTNGWANHATADALAVLAELGYRSVALTIDHHCLSPKSGDWPIQARRIARQLRELGLANVIETGARYLICPRRKHWPSLCAPAAEARLRLELIRHSLQLAELLDSKAVSIWSGGLPAGVNPQVGWDQLIDRLSEALTMAEAFGIPLAMEPEPGMLVARLSDYERLRQSLSHPLFRLTLDIGHLWCQDELPLTDTITRCGAEIVNVHLEDMRRGVHEHLMFGEGEIPFAEVFSALRQIEYRGGVHVELSRHSHAAPATAAAAWRFLRDFLP